ncbi:MAG: hypothetical protein M3N46_06805 [Actinomycetota bacterium]|nr:hypothetical protein [Actinomycetota bacterium]
MTALSAQAPTRPIEPRSVVALALPSDTEYGLLDYVLTKNQPGHNAFSSASTRA